MHATRHHDQSAWAGGSLSKFLRRSFAWLTTHLEGLQCILGAMSAQSVATQAFVSTNTSLADRTKYMSINSLVSNVLTAAGPVFNLLIVALPHFTVRVFGLDFVFNSFTCAR